MATIVNTNNRGFTLIEFLVAVAIMTIGLLGLLQVVNYAILHNMTNQMRQEAYLLADERISVETAKPFELISTPGAARGSSVQRVVNGAFRNYSIIRTNTAPTGKTKQVDLQIHWKYKNIPYTHSIVTLVTNEK